MARTLTLEEMGDMLARPAAASGRAPRVLSFEQMGAILAGPQEATPRQPLSETFPNPLGAEFSGVPPIHERGGLPMPGAFEDDPRAVGPSSQSDLGDTFAGAQARARQFSIAQQAASRSPWGTPSPQSMGSVARRGRPAEPIEMDFPQPPPEPYFTPERAKSAGSSVMRGFTGTLADVPKGAGIQFSQMAVEALADFDRIDRGEAPKSPIGGPSAQAQRYLRADPETRAKMREETARRSDPRNLDIYKSGEAFEKQGKAAFPTDPAVEQEFFAGKVPQALGSTAAFLAGGVAGRALKAPRALVPGVGGGLVSNQSVFADAIKEGSSLETALKASRIGPALGFMEAVPIERLLTRLDKVGGGSISKAVANALKTGTEEGIQEAAQQIAQNLTAAGYYDGDRGVFKDVAEQGAVGFTTGSLIGFLTGLVGGRRGRGGGDDVGEARRKLEPYLEPGGAGAGVQTAQPEAPQSGGPFGEAAVPGTQEPTAATPAPAAPASPAAPPAAPQPSTAAPAAAGGQTGLTVAYRHKGGELPVIFPDAMHRELFDYAMARANRNRPPFELSRRAQALAEQWREWDPGVQRRGAAEIDSFADDLLMALDEEIGRRRTIGAPLDEPFDIGLLIQDPEAVAEYWKRRSQSGQPVPPMPGEKPQPPAPPAFVVTPRGRRLDVAYEVVEAGDLVTSHGDDLTANRAYPVELQPRDRSRAASAEQVSSIAQNLVPELLGPSASATDGAPIVGPDGLVESGNARTIALRRAYGQNLPGAERYRAYLQAQGFKVDGFKQPVLVRRRTTPLDGPGRAAFAAEANERSTAAMSTSEQASADAKAMRPELLDLYQGGDLSLAANREFVRQIIQGIVNPAERGRVATASGELSQEGLARIENAIFARAYEDARLLAALREDTDANIKGVGGAMMDAAPAWAKMRAQAAQDAIPAALDITPSLREAVALVRRARSEGKHLADLLRQTDAFNRTSPEAEAVLRLMFSDAEFRKPASRQKVSGALRFYAEEAMKAQAGPSLLSDMPPVSPLDILKLAGRKGQGGLFDGGIAASRQPVTVRSFEDMGDVLAQRGPSPEALMAETLRPGDEVKTDMGDGFVVLSNKPSAVKGAPGRYITVRWDNGKEAEYKAADLESLLRPAPYYGADGSRKMGGPATMTRAGDVLAQRQAGPRTLSVEQMGELLASRPPGQTLAAAAGNNYVGPVRDAPATGAREIKDPKRRDAILKKLAADLGVPFYQGRIKKQSKMLGFYRPRNDEIRAARSNDLETLAHEAAHLLDYRFPEIRQQWTPASNANARVRAELKGVSYDRDKLYEGFAEFVRLWSTQPQEAQARVPTFSTWWEQFLDRNEHGPAIREFKREALDWYGQDALLRAASKIGPVEAVSETFRGWRDRLRQSVFDDLHGILRAERTLSGDVMPLGPYELARLTRAKESITEGALLYGAPVVIGDSHSFRGKGLRDILKPVSADLDRFWLYAVGVSSNELMGQGREHLFSRNEIAAMKGLETPAFKQAFEDLQVWQTAIMDFAEAKGAIDPTVRRLWKRVQYLPFYRVGAGGADAKSKGVSGDWHGIKALTGGTENLRDVMQNVIRNAATLIDVALTNEARLAVGKMVDRKGGAEFMVRIPTEEKTVRVQRDQIERAILDALGVTSKSQLTPEQRQVVDDIISGLSGLTAMQIKGQAPAGHNVVAALDQGKPVYFEVADPLLFRSLMSLNRPMRGAVTRILGTFRRLGQRTITLSPDFMAANFVRDTLMATIMTRSGFRPLIDSARGMKSRIKADQNYKDFLANGGGLGTIHLEEGVLKRRLERFYGRKGIDFRTVLDTPAKLLDAVDRIAEAFENSTRMGEFMRATEKGESPRRAAYLAREVSTDFAMRGDNEVVGFLFDTIIFLKAGMNGMDRLYRGVAHDPHRARVAVATGALALASLGLAAWNYGNPLYDDDTEDWDKDSSWHIFVPTPAWFDFYRRTGERYPKTVEEAKDLFLHFRSPKIWELGAVASIAERAFELTMKGEPVEFAKDVARIVGNLLHFEYLPQAIAPLYEQAINENRFTDRPIVSRGQEDLQAWAQSSPYGSTTLRKLGEAVRDVPGVKDIYSPARVEALLRGYFNTFAMYGLSLADAAFYDDAPDKRLDQYPVIRRFYREHPAGTSKAVEQFYEFAREATEARRTLRQMSNTHRPDIAEDMATDAANLDYRQMTTAERRLQAVDRELRLMLSTRDLREAQKMAEDYGKATKSNLVPNLKLRMEWDDLGAIKRRFRDEIVQERNKFAKGVVDNVKERRKALEAR